MFEYRGYHVNFDEKELKRIREESRLDIESDFCGTVMKNALCFDLVVRDYGEHVSDGFGKDGKYRLDLNPFLLGCADETDGWIFDTTISGVPYDCYEDGAGSVRISQHSSYKTILNEIIDEIDMLIELDETLAEYANKTNIRWIDAEV